MNLTLTRFYTDVAATGILSVAKVTFFTIERPWLNNAGNVSCVPEGVYELVPYVSPKHGQTWYLRNHALGVGAAGEHRSYCEIHSANWAEQLEGCIALGLDHQPMLDPLTGKVEPAVEGSRDAIAQFIALLGPMTAGHTLTITSVHA